MRVGGNDDKRFPGFNGIFTRILFNHKVGAYISKVDTLIAYLKTQGPEPSFTLGELISKTI